MSASQHFLEKEISLSHSRIWMNTPYSPVRKIISTSVGSDEVFIKLVNLILLYISNYPLRRECDTHDLQISQGVESISNKPHS